MWIGHRKEIRKPTFRALALRRSELIGSDEGLTLETSVIKNNLENDLEMRYLCKKSSRVLDMQLSC